MASYGLKYFWQKDRDGVVIRLEIHQRDYSGASREIYALQSLGLEFQGGDDAIDAAIIKTSLNVQIVDVNDVADSDTVKYGGWDEFFTPDSTLYMFVLKQDGTTRWTGYLTPDSYEEDLTYRSPVTLTARDNIGHLQDFDFDLAGYITVHDLIVAAFQKIDFQMTYLIGYDIDMEDADGNDVANLDRVLVNTETFRERSWYDVLAGVLESLGMALRYVDNNRVSVCPLRRMPELKAIHPAGKQIEFLNLSGHRMFVPAAKMIDETFTYDIKDALTIDMQEDSFEEATVTIDGTSVSAYRPVPGRWRQRGNIVCLNNYLYKYKEVVGSRSGDMGQQDALYLSVYPSGESSWSLHNMYAFVNVPPGAVMEIAFQINSRLFVTDNADKTLCTAYSANIVSLKFCISFTGKDDSGSPYTRYFNGEDWQEGESIMTFDVVNPGLTPLRVSTADASYKMSVPDGGTITVSLCGFELTNPMQIAYGAVIDNGGFCVVSGLTMKQVGVDGYKSRKTKTVYDERYNETISRSPSVGQVPSSVSIDVFANGLYQSVAQTGYPPVMYWSWQDRPDEGKMPLAMIVHKQILMYHSRTSCILTGTIRDVTSGDPRFNNIYLWQDRKFLLTGGTLDLLTGHVNNATLRDYEEYEYLWLLENTLKFDRDSLSVPAEGGVLTIGVISNVEWNALAVVGGSTVPVSPAYGSGNGTLSITVPANTTAEALEGYVRLACTSVGTDVDEAVCPITQAAAEISLALDPNPLELDWAGNAGHVDVITNAGSWTAQSQSDWLNVTTSAQKLTVKPDSENSARSSVQKSGSVLVQAGTEQATLQVIQAASGLFINTLSDEFEVAAEGETVQIAIATNTEKFNIIAHANLGHKTLYMLEDGKIGEKIAETDTMMFSPAVTIPGDPGATAAFVMALEIVVPANTSQEEVSYGVVLFTLAGLTKAITIKQAAAASSEIVLDPASKIVDYTGGLVSVSVSAPGEWTAEPNSYAEGWVSVRKTSDTSMEVNISTQPTLGRDTPMRSGAVLVTSGSLTKSFGIFQTAPGVLLNAYQEVYEVPSDGGTVEMILASNAREIGVDASAFPSVAKHFIVVTSDGTIMDELMMSGGLYTIPGDPGAADGYMFSLSFSVPAGTGDRTITFTAEDGGEVKATTTVTIRQS